MALPHYSTQAPGVRQVKVLDEITWDYEDLSAPHVKPYKFFGYGRAHQAKCLGVPSYSHDEGLVKELLEQAHVEAPLCNPVTINLSKYVDKRLVNGWAQQQWDYDCHTPDDCQCDVVVGESKRKRNWDGIILLSGRTTEIDPMVTRYVTVHEYAHILEDALGLIRYPEVKGDSGREVLRDWGRVRGIPAEAWDLSYGPQSHHRMPGEIFANDFRHFLGIRTDWWPHHDSVKPLSARGTKRANAWWEAALAELRDCYKVAIGHSA